VLRALLTSSDRLVSAATPLRWPSVCTYSSKFASSNWFAGARRFALAASPCAPDLEALSPVEELVHLVERLRVDVLGPHRRPVPLARRREHLILGRGLTLGGEACDIHVMEDVESEHSQEERLAETVIAALEARGVPDGVWLIEIEQARLGLKAVDDLLRRLEDAVIRNAGSTPRAH
jgi:hypothetical protein